MLLITNTTIASPHFMITINNK